MNGGSRVAEVLKRHGVPFVFTLCGGHISPILVEAKKRGIRIIDVRHEANAVFAADAVSRLSGIPGVAAVTAGPGVANAICAIKNAQMAQSPLVLIGGATATVLRGRGSLQDIDQLAMITPHVKYVARPNRLRDVIPAIERAFKEAVSGVPGPVFVELAVDLLYDEDTVRSWYAKTTDREDKTVGQYAQAAYIKGHLKWTFQRSDNPQFSTLPTLNGDRASERIVAKAAALLKGAERPLMVLGSQAMLRPHRIGELVAAVERMGIPVYLSGMARGLLGKDHPLQKRHKRRIALKAADVVVLAGVPADFRLDYGSHIARATVVGINLDKTDLKKNRRPDLAIHADPCATLVAIAERMPSSPPPRSEWFTALNERDDARNTFIQQMADQDVDHVNPLKLCQAVEERLADDSVLVGDGGDFVATASYITSPRSPLSWLDPGVFGTLGVGAGFALGAKLVRPDADVWLIWGDGAAGFSLVEFDTFVRHKVPVIALVGNDAGWTQIARDQVVILEDDVGTVLAPTRYDKVVAGFGATGIHIDTAKKVNAGLDKAIQASRAGSPVLVNVRIGATDFRKGSMSI